MVVSFCNLTHSSGLWIENVVELRGWMHDVYICLFVHWLLEHSYFHQSKCRRKNSTVHSTCLHHLITYSIICLLYSLSWQMNSSYNLLICLLYSLSRQMNSSYNLLICLLYSLSWQMIPSYNLLTLSRFFFSSSVLKKNPNITIKDTQEINYCR